jgi:homocysteine S-methyltransferase
MNQYRNALPQLDGSFFLTDGGIETTLIFHDKLDLPDFAAFHLLRNESGMAALRKYFRTYAAIATRFRTGFILESATWRASSDWGARLGYSREALAAANRAAIRLLEEIRDEMPGNRPVVISGCMGPRGDGYVPSNTMSVPEAESYHQEQVDTFAGAAADMVCAVTMNYVEEAIGITRAARKAGMPVAISFTVETDGKLPTGQSLRAAIQEVDAATGSYPIYYMLNCAHPTHFEHVLAREESWTGRIRGLRANASTRSHTELNESADLDTGDPARLGALYAQLRRERMPRLNVMGGCCGTDHRHIECIAAACADYNTSR